MRLVFLGLLLLFFLYSRRLPDVVEWGTVLCLLAAGAFLLLAGVRLAGLLTPQQPLTPEKL